MLRYALAAVLSAGGVTSAGATTYLLSWSGIDARTSYIGGPNGGRLDTTGTETGVGSFELVDNPVSNANYLNLVSFSFTTTLDATEIAYPNRGGKITYPLTQTLSYSLNDVSFFDGGGLTGGVGPIQLVLASKGGETFTANGNATSKLSFFNLAPSGPLVATQASGVPEVTSWGLMLCGFGLVGSAMRQRRAKIAAA